MLQRIAAVTLCLFSFLIRSQQAPDRPNVLFIIADDLNTALSGYGHPRCLTPNLDRLAEQGMRFARAYCQYPVCGASRASIMSGLYPYSNGVMGNGIKLRDRLPDALTLPQFFLRNGYWTGRVGKIYHMGIPSEIIAGTSQYDDPDSWLEAYNIQAPEQNSAGFKVNHSPKNNSSQAFIRVEADEGDLIQADGKAAQKAMELLEKNSGKPFFLGVGFVRPHVPLVAPKDYFKPYPIAEMEPPQVPEDDLEDVPSVIRDYKTTESYGMGSEDIQGALSAYYASVSFMDAQVGKVLNKLHDLGLGEKTVVVFTSDHGYNLGEHHKWQKQHLFEESTRVPLIISVPWIKHTHGKITEEITESLDIYPTLAQLAGLDAPGFLQGSSLVPLLQDPKSKAWKKEVALTVSRSNGAGIRTKDWRYTEWDEGDKGVELYDLNKDPHEWNNVAGDPDYASILQRMKGVLALKRAEAGYQSR